MTQYPQCDRPFCKSRATIQIELPFTAATRPGMDTIQVVAQWRYGYLCGYDAWKVGRYDRTA